MPPFVRVCSECNSLTAGAKVRCRKCGADISKIDPVDAETLPSSLRGESPPLPSRTPTAVPREPSVTAVSQRTRHSSLNSTQPKLLPNEEVLFRSERGTLLLTSHRVTYTAQFLGRDELITMMLEDVASCAQMHSRHPFFVVLALLAGATGLFRILVEGSESGGVLLIVAVGLLLLYLFAQSNLLVVRSAGHSIQVDAASMQHERVRQFIEILQAAKDRRYQRSRDVHANPGLLNQS
jgi:hypothetical protein